MVTSNTFDRIKNLVSEGRVLVSAHGYDELAADGIFFQEIVDGLSASELVEDYPDAAKGPTVLILIRDMNGKPVHAVLGIPAGADGPAVLVTAYRPDPKRWSEDFKERRR